MYRSERAMVTMIAYLSVDVGGSIKFVELHALVRLTRRVDPPAAGLVPQPKSRAYCSWLRACPGCQVARIDARLGNELKHVFVVDHVVGGARGVCHLVCVSCRSARRRPPSR